MGTGGTPVPNDQLTGDGPRSFAYDPNGNRTSAPSPSMGEGGGGGVTYDTGPDNRLLSDGTWNYSYDAEGNLTKKVNFASGQTWTYGYDHRNQLVEVERRTTDGGALEMHAEYKYDVFGLRHQKVVDSDGNGSADLTQRYALDGWDIYADLDASSSLTTRYVRGDVVDQLFARLESDGDAFWDYTDHLGSIRDITDSSGVVVDALTYDAFGNILSETDFQYRGRYAWTGRELDAETGLQYNRARYYDSATGRWLSQDPLAFGTGDSNLYRYVNNRPTMASDPSGLENESIWGLTSPPKTILVVTDPFGLNGPITKKVPNPEYLQWLEDAKKAGAKAKLQSDLVKIKSGRKPYGRVISEDFSSFWGDPIRVKAIELKDGSFSTVSGKIMLDNSVPGHAGSWIMEVDNVGGYGLGVSPTFIFDQKKDNYYAKNNYLKYLGYDSKLPLLRTAIAVVDGREGAVLGYFVLDVVEVGLPAAQAVKAAKFSYVSASAGRGSGCGGISAGQINLGKPLPTAPASTTVSSTTRAAEQLAIRERVLANIAESQAARNASNFHVHAAIEDLYTLTRNANARLGANPSLASTVLSPAEYAAAQRADWLGRMFYGHAVERLVAQDIAASPQLAARFRYVAGANNPDFVGRAGLTGINFDITTNTPLQILRHSQRPYRPILILYERPAGFTGFP